MGLRSGLAAQVGVKAESVVGTPVTVDSFSLLRDETLTEGIVLERLEDPGIRAGRRIYTADDWGTGRTMISGKIQQSAYTAGQEPWWLQLFGAVVKTGAGPYVRTHTIGDLTDDSLSIQVGKPGTGGTVHPFTFGGCVISEAEIKWAAGTDPVSIGWDITAMNFAVTTPTLAAASYIAGAKAFLPVSAVLTVGGTAVKVKSGSIKINNGYDLERWFAGQTTLEQPYEAALRTLTFTLDHEFIDLTHHARYAAASEHSLVVTFTNGSITMVITANVHYDALKSGVKGPGLVGEQSVYKVNATSGGTDAAAITAVLTNSVA